MADETQECSNCKKQISKSNFTIHSIHCQRNFSICKRCNDVFPVNELQQHLETAHKKIRCQRCSEELESYKFDDHENYCPKRLVQCLYCDLEVYCDELNEHENYCGTRTELCQVCNQYVMLRDQTSHEAAGHPPVDKKTNTNNNRFSPLRNDFTTDQLMSIPYYPKKANVETDLYTRQSPSKRNNDMPQVNTNFPVDRKKPEKTSIIDVETDSGSQVDIDLDRLIASQFQEMVDSTSPGLGGLLQNALFTDSVRDTSPLPSDFYSEETGFVWNQPVDGVYKTNPDVLNHQNFLGRAPNTSGSGTFITEDGLPCEFCGELYPADLLIQHESGCRPDIAHGFRPISCIEDRHPRENLFEPIGKMMSNENKIIMLPCEHCLDTFPEEILLQHEELCPKNPEIAEIAAEEFLRGLGSSGGPPTPPPRRFSDVSLPPIRSNLHQSPSIIANKPVNRESKPPADRKFGDLSFSPTRTRSHVHERLIPPVSRTNQVASLPNPNVKSFASYQSRNGSDTATSSASSANLARRLPDLDKGRGEYKNMNVTKPKSTAQNLYLQEMKCTLNRAQDAPNLVVTGAKPKSTGASAKPDPSGGNQTYAPKRQQTTEKSHVPSYCKSNDGQLEDAYHRFLAQRRAQYGANTPQRANLQSRLKQTGAVPKTTKKSSSEE